MEHVDAEPGNIEREPQMYFHPNQRCKYQQDNSRREISKLPNNKKTLLLLISLYVQVFMLFKLIVRLDLSSIFEAVL